MPASPKTQLLLGENKRAVYVRPNKEGAHTHSDLEEGSSLLSGHTANGQKDPCPRRPYTQ